MAVRATLPGQTPHRSLRLGPKPKAGKWREGPPRLEVHLEGAQGIAGDQKAPEEVVRACNRDLESGLASSGPSKHLLAAEALHQNTILRLRCPCTAESQEP